jgi:mono/diheme cytochrome c family protein
MRLRLTLLVLVPSLLSSVACKKSGAATEPSAEGAALFASTCARCHGADGVGGLPLWEGGPSPRNFHDHGFHASHSDADLKRIVREGKPPGMPPFSTILTEAQIDSVVAHVRSLDPEKAK